MIKKISHYLTIIAYHYVQDFPKTFYPKIKGRLTSEFIGQLEYFQKYYKIIKMEDCIGAFMGINELPKNACLLTFDDGLIDHYLTVFPILHERGLSGSFFIPVKPITENIVLDVHKIHYILATTTDYKKLIDHIFNIIESLDPDYFLSNKEMFNSILTTQKTTHKSNKRILFSNLDSTEVIFIKKLLQYVLPNHLRSNICSKLFEMFITKNEIAFSKSLYMNTNQLKLMINSGMHIGGHGYSHEWLEKLTKIEQEKEIKLTLEFLEQIYNNKPINWTMSYPKNSYDDTTVRLLKKNRCQFGFTYNPILTEIDLKLRFEMPRFDTNDFPITKYSQINKWTKKIIISE